ncbi:MBL fold metallo-hydrolase [Methanonatronarchaeum sp. AMET6-2]|uniref:MBL fold metallo-hydrolase n=1 Tax=Methanonatronarchaeum sp. AMET6-2 TaxID=2933293 RepID=UPI0011FDC5E0|nr:MBL fold metallo-hydrolase [Methanonatronarchaeum sp. AMET6-2]RZN60990.1 MAG: MBL fold metallo-hydrolase [Methanonatronarchaeia archaeon]UOY10684.1 MBL fold metallo-hydrolase [Methanonatronarchaeum sp. AMET6-2]
MKEIIFLGAGWAVPTKERGSTSILIKTNKNILLDCGGNVAQKLVKTDTPLTEIHQIYLTHAHTDHIDGLPGLLHASWLSGRENDINIVGSPKTIGKTRNIIKSYEFDFPFNINYKEIEGKGSINDVQYTEVEHKDQSLAYRHKDITYSGDTKPCDNLQKLAMNTELLIHEATFPSTQQKKAIETRHSTVKDAVKTAKQTKANKLALIHHKPEVKINQEIKEAKKTIDIDIDITAPRDLDKIQLN